MADDNPKNADFVGRVVSDAKNPPDTQMLTGWFGDSGEEGYRRLYTEAELNNYVDIPDDAILNTEPIRDVQPSGGVFVWIRRDAALKPGGSAASRAARFLQGQVQQDFDTGASGSLEKAGLRCVTEVPCGEPTGFTGQCTKQPEVGGAWPCITAIPHCFEVTGFTGKCTHAPWPNPTRYIGCTYLHCPTNDLTHIPQICNIVASGLPGCVVVDPQQGGDPALNAGAYAEEKALPVTHIPGCGYTKTWGVCETHLLGCGAAAQDNAQAAYITSICAPTAFCHVSQNCGAAAAAQAAAQPASAICATAIGCDITFLCHTRFPALCFPTPICPTRPQQCFRAPSPFCPVTQACPFGTRGGGGTPVQHGIAAFGAAAPDARFVVNTDAPCSAVDSCPSRICDTQPPTALCTPNPQFCPTFCGLDCQTNQPHPVCTSLNCLTRTDPQCSPSNIWHDCTSIGSTCPTRGQPGCPTTVPNACPTSVPACNARAGAQAFAAAQPQAAGGIHPTIWTQIGVQCPSHLLGCTQFGPQCLTYPQGDCTFFGCPSRGIDCTVVVCTHVGPLCQNTAATVCTQTGPQCPHPSLPGQLCPITAGGPQCPPASGIQCPSQLCQSVACQSIACQPGGGEEQQAAFFARQPVAQEFAAAQLGPTGFLGCTQFAAKCPTYPNGDCTFFGCPSIPQFALAGPGAGCTQSGPQCPTHGQPQCTFAGPVCPPTHVTACTQFPPQCPQHTNAGPLCPHTAGNACAQIHPQQGTAFLQCHRRVSLAQCPTQFLCQSVPCFTPGCQAGGGGQQAFAAFDQSTDFCPTSMGCGGVAHPQAAVGYGVTSVGPNCHPTQAAGCGSTQHFCSPVCGFAVHPQAAVASGPGYGCTYVGPNCQATQAPGCGATQHLCSPVCGFAVHPQAAVASGPGYGCTYVGPNCQATRAPGCGATHHFCTPVCG